MEEERVQRKLAAILVADVFGYSRLMRDDEIKTVNTLSAYREVMTSLIRQHRGRIVDAKGDNILSEFPSVVDAMQSAVSIQKELSAHNAQLPENRKMHFRIGINIGDVIQEGDSIYGDGVNIAARLESMAEPGGICISRMAYDQIESKLPLGYEYLGEQHVKNINKPLYAYRVIIDPENIAREEMQSEQYDSKKKPRHSKHKSDGKQFEKSFLKAKDHLKDFAKDMKEDEQLGETFHEIKDQVRSFADDIAGSPERRQRALHSLIQNTHIRVFLGLTGIFFLINAAISFGTWWFLYPLVSFGLALYLHWLKVSFLSPEKIKIMRQRLLQEELAQLDTKAQNDRKTRKRLERHVKARVRFYRHVYTYAGINAFLLLLNLIISPFNWWFHFPLLGWGAGLFFHWMKISMRRIT